MVQALHKAVTFEEFIEWKPDGGRYELHDGVIVEMSQPLGGHEEVTGFVAKKLTIEFDRLNLPYFIPKQALIKAPGRDVGYLPDVLILDPTALKDEPLWQKASTVTQGASIPLVVEVVSSNWRVDYGYKLTDYEEIGIPEYWIVDYLALGGTRHIGKPKQPTISIYYLVEEEYQLSQFRGDDRILSPTFPDLNLTANQIFQAAYLSQ
ncbi:MAG TPA: Uma2 family endonuclease [Nostocaceae cyanobacterium]|nr:Uma2 family endonuclease [Nostocaceae cyanobacterium]